MSDSVRCLNFFLFTVIFFFSHHSEFYSMEKPKSIVTLSPNHSSFSFQLQMKIARVLNYFEFFLSNTPLIVFTFTKKTGSSNFQAKTTERLIAPTLIRIPVRGKQSNQENIIDEKKYVYI